MKKLNYKEIYQLKLQLGISFSDAEAVMNIFFYFKSCNKQFGYYELVPQSNHLDSTTDYYNVYMNQNCYIYSSIEELIKDEEKRGDWDFPQSGIHQRVVDFILDSIDNTVFKLENGHYIQFYF